MLLRSSRIYSGNRSWNIARQVLAVRRMRAMNKFRWASWKKRASANHLNLSGLSESLLPSNMHNTFRNSKLKLLLGWISSFNKTKEKIGNMKKKKNGAGMLLRSLKRRLGFFKICSRARTTKRCKF